MHYFRKGLSFLTLVMLTFSSIYSQTANENPENLYQQFRQVSQQLQQIQQKALEDEKIISMTEAFTAKVEARMVKENPGLQETLDKKDELINKYDAAEKTGNTEQLEKIKTEFQEVAQKLLPAQQQIVEQSEFKTEATRIETAVQDKMTEINPNTPQLIAKMNELKSQIEQGYNQ